MRLIPFDRIFPSNIVGPIQCCVWRPTKELTMSGCRCRINNARHKPGRGYFAQEYQQNCPQLPSSEFSCYSADNVNFVVVYHVWFKFQRFFFFYVRICLLVIIIVTGRHGTIRIGSASMNVSWCWDVADLWSATFCNWRLAARIIAK